MADIASRLSGLEEILREGLITQEDYERTKDRITNEFITETSPYKDYGGDQGIKDELINIILPRFNEVGGNIGVNKLGEMEEYVNSISGQELEQTYQTMVDALNKQMSAPTKGIERFIGPEIGLTEAQLMPDLWTSLLKSQGTRIKPPMFGAYNVNQPWKPHIVKKPRFEEKIGIESIVPQAVGLTTAPGQSGGGGRDVWEQGDRQAEQRQQSVQQERAKYKDTATTGAKAGYTYGLQKGGVVSLMDLLNRRV